jgi:ferredoxin-NADP reductase
VVHQIKIQMNSNVSASTKGQSSQDLKMSPMEELSKKANRGLVVKIRSICKLTPDVLRIVTDKPENYVFCPGQATEISINKKGWETMKRPFTFTSTPTENYLEFTIKTYPSKKGLTNQLLSLTEWDELILHDVFGAIAYKGVGTFIAGGAGVTPFIAIFRNLVSKKEIGNNRLIFANKKKTDIILETEFRKMLGLHFVNILSDEAVDGYAHGMLTEAFIEKNRGEKGTPFYVCGPPAMMDAVEEQLFKLHVKESDIVKEII